jgi:hypothetical protein
LSASPTLIALILTGPTKPESTATSPLERRTRPAPSTFTVKVPAPIKDIAYEAIVKPSAANPAVLHRTERIMNWLVLGLICIVASFLVASAIGKYLKSITTEDDYPLADE